MTYQGKLNVKVNSNGTNFGLQVDRLILRDNEIAFTFYGVDDDGKFKIEGNATGTKRDFKSDACFFETPELRPVEYKDYPNKDNEVDQASIQFTSVKEETIQNKNTCTIKGTWLQDGESWDFDGTLDKFDPQ